jgi:hypothetical protein
MDFSALDKALSIDSALEAEIKRLEVYSDALSTWLEISTFLVVLGVILEIPSIVGFIREALDKRPFIFKELIKRRKFNWKKFRETVGGILVVLGVSGELIFQALISVNETDLREARGKLTTHARALAANAVTIASAAESNLENARKAASEAQERAAKAEKATEDEKIERLKLEKQVAPRKLTPEQQTLIARSLRPFKGRKLRLISYWPDLEAIILGGQIKLALQNAGLVVDNQLAGVATPGQFAVGIPVNGPPEEQDLVNAIADSFTRDGKLLFVGRGTKPVPGADPRDGVNILVAVKPVHDLASVLKK